MGKLASEVAEASRVLSNDLPARHTSTKHTDELVRVAKHLERLQRRRRTLRKDLKIIESEIKRAKRDLKALAHDISKGQ